MKKLLITLLLVSPFSFADWGDVYYLPDDYLNTISRYGTRTSYRPGKFQFKLDELEGAMVFG